MTEPDLVSPMIWIAVVTGVLVIASRPPPRDSYICGGGSRERRAMLAVEEYATSYFPKWEMAHNNQPCPLQLLDVLAYVGHDADDLFDPWGQPHMMFCGAPLPGGAQTTGIGVLSLGPDEIGGTQDDIRSWRRP